MITRRLDDLYLPRSRVAWMLQLCQRINVVPDRVDDLLVPLTDEHAPTTITWQQYLELLETMAALAGKDGLMESGRLTWRSTTGRQWLDAASDVDSSAYLLEQAFSTGGFCVQDYPLEVDVKRLELEPMNFRLIVKFPAAASRPLCFLLAGQLTQLTEELELALFPPRLVWHPKTPAFEVSLKPHSFWRNLRHRWFSVIGRETSAQVILDLLKDQAKKNDELILLGSRAAAEQQAASTTTAADLAWLAPILALSDEGLMVFGADHQIQWASPAVQKLLGHHPDALLGTTITALFPKTLSDNDFHRFISGELDHGSAEINAIHGDGGLAPLAVRFNSVSSDAGQLYCCALTDLSELRGHQYREAELASQLAAAERLATLGLLSGEIAHDFSNLLVALQGHCELARADPHSTDVSTHLAAIGETADKGQQLTQQLLSYGQSGDITKSEVQISRLVLGMEQLIRRLLPESIQLTVACETGDACVSGIKAQLEQILLNLAVNARDAMPKGGELNLAATLDSSQVLIEVVDTGTGMDDLVREKIFEAFYTTKGDQGTGLGLAVVAANVDQHNGSIMVDSKPGRGTRFTITLPVIDEHQTLAGVS